MAFKQKQTSGSPFAVQPRAKGKVLFFILLFVFLVSAVFLITQGRDVYLKNKRPFVVFDVDSPFLRPDQSLINPQPMFKPEKTPAEKKEESLLSSFMDPEKSVEERLKGPKTVDEALKSAMLNYPPQKEVNDRASLPENPDLPVAKAPKTHEPEPVLERVIDVKDEFALRRPSLPAPDPVQDEFMNSLPNFGAIKGGQNKGSVPLDILTPLSELQSESRFGKIPVKTKNGETPFQSYARPHETPVETPYIAVLISGLGKRKNTTTAALYSLPAEVSLSFSPYSERLGDYVIEARKSGHETLLDLPMQQGSFPETDPGPLGLVAGLPEKENRKRLHRTLGKDVAYIGLTASPNETFSFTTNQMGAFSKEIRDRGLIYVDGTENEEMPLFSSALRPDVFIMDNYYRSAIRARLDYAKQLALKKGSAFIRAETAPIVLLTLREWMDSFKPEDDETPAEITFVPLSYYAGEVLKTRK